MGTREAWETTAPRIFASARNDGRGCFDYRQDLSAVSSAEDGESCLQQLRDAELGVTLVAPALLALPRRVDDVVGQPAISAPILEAGSG